MKKFFTENIGLKLLSLALSFGLWLVVVNYDDPVISATYNGIPVEIVNADSLALKGKVYEVKDGTDNISVTVTGKRSVVESISKENIIATADISNLTIMDTVEIYVSTNKNFEQLDAIKSDNTSVSLNIEDLQIKHLPLSIDVAGTPQDGYVVGDVATNQNTISISGPKSIVDTIEKAEISVDVQDRSSDIATTASVLVYDKDDKMVTASNVSLNINAVNVSVAILSKKAVDVICGYNGTPAEGYALLGDLEMDRKAVYIAGKSATIEHITAIEIPATVFSIQDKKEDYSQQVDLNRYLPEGVRLAEDDFEGVITVTADIEKQTEKVLNVPMKNIHLDNIPEGFTASLYVRNNDVGEDDEQGQVSLKLPTRGIPVYYTGVTGDSIKATIDVQASLTESGRIPQDGSIYQMVIVYEIPEGIEVVEECYAEVKLEKEKG